MGFINHLYSGRIGRLHFAVLAIIMLVVNVFMGMFIIPHLAMMMGSIGAILGLLLGFFISIMTLHLYVRRFHDMNMSGWWVVGMLAANLVSVLVGNVVALLFFIFLSAKKGDSGTNTHGREPDHRSFADAYLNQ